MKITVRQSGSVIILDILGEIIGWNALEFCRTLEAEIEKGSVSIILNLNKVPLLSSIVLGMAIGADIRLRTKDGKVVLLKATDGVNGLLDSHRFTDQFEKYDDEDVAIQSFKQ